MLPVRLHFVAVVCLLMGGCVADGVAQEAKRPEFDVASVRQNKTDDKPTSTFSLDNGNVYSTVNKGDVFAPPGGYFSATNQPLWRYISFAYNLSGTQELALRFSYFSGLSNKTPAWVSGGFDAPADRFDVMARSDGHPTKDQVRLMMQALLADRFKLAAHLETREAPVFALVAVRPGQAGARLVPHPASDTCAAESDAPAPQSSLGELPRVCGVIAHLPTSEPGHVRFGGRGVPLSLLATSLPTMTGMGTVGRPVVDESKLSGMFDFTLEWRMEFNAPTDASGPDFRGALKDQLGLKLEPKQAPVELLVIDHVERPSAN